MREGARRDKIYDYSDFIMYWLGKDSFSISISGK